MIFSCSCHWMPLTPPDSLTPYLPPLQVCNMELWICCPGEWVLTFILLFFLNTSTFFNFFFLRFEFVIWKWFSLCSFFFNFVFFSKKIKRQKKFSFYLIAPPPPSCNNSEKNCVNCFGMIFGQKRVSQCLCIYGRYWTCCLLKCVQFSLCVSFLFVAFRFGNSLGLHLKYNWKNHLETVKEFLSRRINLLIFGLKLQKYLCFFVFFSLFSLYSSPLEKYCWTGKIAKCGFAL